MKKDFPPLIPGEEIKRFLRFGNYLVAEVEKTDIVKLYFWDQVSELYNYYQVFEKVK